MMDRGKGLSKRIEFLGVGFNVFRDCKDVEGLEVRVWYEGLWIGNWMGWILAGWLDPIIQRYKTTSG